MNTTARDEILARLQTALADRPQPEPAARDYRLSAPVDLDQFVDRLLDYHAEVVRTSDPDAAIDTALRGYPSVVIPAGFPGRAANDQFEIAELDQVDAVLTTCALAVAETGTIVLDAGPGQGRRALTLVPDVHVVLVRAAQVVATVPEAVARLDPRAPLTWISGPSATSDIELDRVEGVHGPRLLRVILAE